MEFKLPKIIRVRLKAFESRRRWVEFWRALAETLMILLGGVLVVMALESLVFRRAGAAVWLSAGNYLAAGSFFIWRAGHVRLRARSLKDIARHFERAAGNQFQEQVFSAVQMAQTGPAAQRGVSWWMVEQTIAGAARDLKPVDAGNLVNAAPARRAWNRAALAGAAFALACLAPGFWPRARVALAPFSSVGSFSRLSLTVSPGNCRLKQGAALQMVVSANEPLEQARTFVQWQDGFQETVSMTRSGTNEFGLTLPAVSQGFQYRVEADEAQTAVFTVRVDTPPRVANLRLLIEPPAYTATTNRAIESGTADFLEGSLVRLELMAAGEKVARAEFLAEGAAPLLMRPARERLTLELAPTNAMTYQIRLTGANGLQSESSQKWTLQPVPDRPPTAQLAAMGVGTGMVERDELLPLQVEASDDVGLKAVDLLVLGGETEADVRRLYAASTNATGAVLEAARQFKAPVNYNLADLHNSVAGEIQVQLLATDLRGQRTRSEPIALTLGSPDRAREAQLAARLEQLLSVMDEQIEYLGQTRSSWLSLVRNYRPEDPDEQGPAATLLKSRLNEFAAEMDVVGDTLVGESETNALPEARFMYRFGTSLSAWGAQQRTVLLENCSRLTLDGRTNVVGILDQGRELFNRALDDLQEYRRVLTILQGTFATDVLATRCETAQGRYQRGLPVLRGDNVMAPLLESGSGLLADFFEGINLDGKLLERKIAAPTLDNYAPAGRREQWSARFEGDLRLPESGDWALACVADDGVRLVLEGKSMLPKDAWSAHPATQYKTETNLVSGWRPIVIEFFQGYSESKLQFLASKKGAPLQPVPLEWLRPPSARPKPAAPQDPAVQSIVQDALQERVKSSLKVPGGVPRALVPLTNVVHNENLTRAVRDKLPEAELLSSNLLAFASWKNEQSQQAQSQADDLTGLSRDARRILREELEKQRWRYEGAAALKPIQNALQELREINQDLRRQPHNSSKPSGEQQQEKIAVAQAWHKELRSAAAATGHEFFETAKQRDATLAERVLALNATTKTEKELQPAIEKLGAALDADTGRDEMIKNLDQRLNEISDRYRELNDVQERINREQIAAEARRAWPAARAFARAQRAAAPNQEDTYQRLRLGVDRVEKAQRVAGEYDPAQKLDALAGHSPQDAKGKETADVLRNLAMQTDNNPPSLAQTIPPPMQDQTVALDQHQVTGSESANVLAKPRLAMTLEAGRLYRQNDARTGVAYDLLGQDLGGLLEAPPRLTAQTLKPLADRAAALAGQKGEEARQAEIATANNRLKQMAAEAQADPQALAARLDALSGMAMQAAGDASQRQPLNSELGEVAGLATPSADWSESANPREIAAGAANESLTGIEAAPKQRESYHQASEVLNDAARQIRIDNAVSDLAGLTPYPAPQSGARATEQAVNASGQEQTGKMEGPGGKAITEPAPKGLDQAEWARLNQLLRQAIRSSGIEHFNEEQQAAIRAYFERLSTEK